MCYHILMYNGRHKNINSKTNCSIKYISNIHRDVMQNKIYCNWIMINMYFKVCVRILIDERGREIEL